MYFRPIKFHCVSHLLSISRSCAGGLQSLAFEIIVFPWICCHAKINIHSIQSRGTVKIAGVFVLQFYYFPAPWLLSMVMMIWSRIRAFDWYRPRWPSMTLNGVIALMLRFFTEFDSFAGRLCHSGWRQTYNFRKILSPSSSLPLLAKTNAPAVRSLCDSWATCCIRVSCLCTLHLFSSLSLDQSSRLFRDLSLRKMSIVSSATLTCKRAAIKLFASLHVRPLSRKRPPRRTETKRNYATIVSVNNE